MCNPIAWYIQCPLRATVDVMKYIKYISILIAVLATGYIFLIFNNLLNSPQNFDTIKKLEHAPLTMPMMVIVTHLVFGLLGNKIASDVITENKVPPSPSLYVFFIGKIFMVYRMVLAYSSGDYGRSIEFFIWEELILTIIQTFVSIYVYPTLGLSYDCNNVKGQEKLWKVVIVLDFTKDAAITLLWKYFAPGGLSTLFNRINGFNNQLIFFVYIHVVFDVLQSLTTTFSLYMAKWCRTSEENEEERRLIPPLLENKSSMLRNCQYLDYFFIHNLFIGTDRYKYVEQHCKNLLEVGPYTYSSDGNSDDYSGV